MLPEEGFFATQGYDEANMTTTCGGPAGPVTHGHWDMNDAVCNGPSTL